MQEKNEKRSFFLYNAFIYGLIFIQNVKKDFENSRKYSLIYSSFL